MVSVNGVNSDLKVHQVQAEGETAVDKASTGQQGIVYGGEFGEDVQIKTKRVDPQELDFSNFTKKYAITARKEAREVIQDLEDQINRHNRKNPNNQVFIDFTNFPNPKKYDKKTNGGNVEVYEAWSDALRHWEKQETNRLDDAMDVTIVEVANQLTENQQKLANLINAGRYEVYINAGITQARIEQLAQEVNYNFDNLTVMLNKEFQKTRAHTTNVGANVTGQIGKHLDSVYEKLDGKIDDATEEIKGTVQAEGLNTRITVAGVGADVVDKVNQNTNAQGQQTKEIESVSTAISSAIHDWQDVFRADSTIDEVETLKQEIIKSSNIDHNKKMELLNKLLNLVNNDALITDNDLKAIHTETKSIL